MDKYEYKVRLEEINTLVKEYNIEEAANIADSIDWRKVKSIKTLCMISDIYKYVGRLEDAEEMLVLAYERHPNSKSVVFALCELCIKLDQYVQALEYYKEYVQLAPSDYGVFVLRYKLYVAQDVSLEERIDVLKELKKNTPIPKWQYELAYLYHRIGDSAHCIEECDEIILWYGEGKYVTKAMELKMQHSPLTPTQQAKYDTREITASLVPVEEETYTTIKLQPEAVRAHLEAQEAANAAAEAGDQEDSLQVKTDVGMYNTINLQKELANSMKDMWEVTPDNLIRPVNTSLSPEDEKDIAESSTSAFQVIEKETVEVDKNGEEKSKEIIPDDERGREGFVEDDPMATKVLMEIRAEHNTEDLKSAFVEAQQATEFPSEYDKFLGMEYDGQMSLVVPEEVNDEEKQITGQLHIEDILAEWEQKKKDSEKQFEEEVKQRVLEHTGNILVDFDVTAREGLLEQLEKEPIDDSAYDYLPPEDEEDENAESEDAVEEIAEYSEEYPEEYAEEELSDAEEEAGEMTFEEELTDTSEIPEEVVEEEAELAEEEPAEEKAEETAAEPEKEASEDSDESEANAEVVAAEAAAEADEDSDKPRELTKEEKELYASYIQNKKIQRELVNAVDSVSLAPYAGNIIITGDEGMDPTTLAKNIMKEIQIIDSNFSGKIAKISGNSLNVREPAEIIGKISNGALIIESAGKMSAETCEKLYKSLQNEDAGIIIVLTGAKKSIGKMLDGYSKLKECFAAQIDLEALDNDTLVRFGREYALSHEYSIDEMGLLALHTKISDNQTSDHAVTMVEVKRMVSDAIRNAERKNLGHFFDILFGKRYDSEDMIILKEKDFA